MNEELKNKEKRKDKSLTLDEWLGFFFIPLNISPRIFPVKDFNEHEEDRFERFGFDKKLRQSSIARILGILFYIILITVLMKIFN